MYRYIYRVFHNFFLIPQLQIPWFKINKNNAKSTSPNSGILTGLQPLKDFKPKLPNIITLITILSMIDSFWKDVDLY